MFRRTLRATILRVLGGSFSWERTPENDRRILCHAADLHRQYRCLLKKKYFDESVPVEEMKRRVPKGINAIIWGKLIDYWSFEEYKKKVGKNKENRAKGIHPTHKMGRKNINQKTEEFKKHSRVPTRVEMYLLTKTREVNGERLWDSEKLHKEHDEIVRLMTPSSNESISGEPTLALSAEKAFTVMKGPERSGRVRCAGRGAIPSTWCGGMGDTSTQEVVKLRSTVEILKEKLCTDEEKMTIMMEMHRLDM